MELTFAGVVDEVRQLSVDEKKELVDILGRDLLDERRGEILQNCEASQKEYDDGKLVFSSNVHDLMTFLDN